MCIDYRGLRRLCRCTTHWVPSLLRSDKRLTKSRLESHHSNAVALSGLLALFCSSEPLYKFLKQKKASQGEDRWSEGPEDGGTARTAAARCAAELAGDGAVHLALVESGLAEALAVKAAELVRDVAYPGHAQPSVGARVLWRT